MPDQSKTTLRDMVYVLFRFKWLVLFLFLLIFFGGTAMTFTAPRIYEATSSIMISFNNTRLRLTSVESNSRLSVEQQIFTEIEFIKSWNVVQNALETLKTAGTVPKDYELSSVVANLRVESVRNTTVISTAYRDKNPERARDILNEIIRQYISRRSITVDNSQEEKRYTEMLLDLDDRIEDVENSLTDFKGNRNIFNLDVQLQQESTILEKLRSMELELQQAVLRKSETIAEMREKLSPFDPNQLPSDLINEDAALRSLLEVYNDLETKTMLNRSRLTARNSEVVLAQEDLLAIEKELALRYRGSIETFSSDLSTNQSHLELVQNEINQVENRIRDLAVSTNPSTNLEKRLGDLQSIRTVLSQKLEETRILAQGEDRILYEQVSPARAPESPKSPNVQFNLILSLAIALVFSLVTPFYVQLFDARIVSDTDVKAATGRMPIHSINRY